MKPKPTELYFKFCAPDKQTVQRHIYKMLHCDVTGQLWKKKRTQHCVNINIPKQEERRVGTGRDNMMFKVLDAI